MNINSTNFLSIEQMQEKLAGNKVNEPITPGNNVRSFQNYLESISRTGKELKFSKHAAGRLATRDITLDDAQLERLSSGMEKANAKGIKDSLMIMDKLAFIVNVPSQTVVTAMDSMESDEQVFTNIDGAVIV
ncbi:MAG: flagellar protein [Lachnospiraceae bacterium]|nr:flagellar protein [Candidatus Colinaster equi]